MSKLGIIFAVIFWILEIDDRKKERDNLQKQSIYRAWEVITISELMPSSQARKYALEDLVNSEQLLDGIDLRVANLEGAKLANASFKGSILSFISFSGADLQCANFNFCFLDEVDFGDAKLENATFKGAVIKGSNFSSVQNRNTLDFSGAILFNNTGLKVNNKLVHGPILSQIQNLWEKPSDYLNDEELKEIIAELKSTLH
ncbi:pentapeptide repeat-containing protein [Zobellia nedashkovskayae]